ncbi:MAG: hypothetical protein ACHQIL_12645 [Steroidobacterales bacterium]
MTRLTKRVIGAPAARLAACAALLVLGACHGKEHQDAATALAAKHAAAAAKQHVATGAEQTAGMVEAATMGKATAPLQLKFELPVRPVAGQPFAINLALIPGIAAQSATLQFGDSVGLVIADASDRQIGAVMPDTPYRQEVTLSGAADGVYFLAVNATLKHEETVETRAYSIPIIVAAH